jgi:hypothetical protein
MQIETNCPHARNGTHTGGGGASAEAGPVVGGGGVAGLPVTIEIPDP